MQVDFTVLKPAEMEKTGKDAIVARIGDGKVLPIVGSIFANDLAFGSHEALLQGWASYTRYPLLHQPGILAQIAQYAAVQKSNGGTGDDVLIKETYVEFLKMALQYMASQNPSISSRIVEEVDAQRRDLTPSEMARRFGFPSLSSAQDNSLLILAALPLPIYITTSYHDFLEVALREKLGKEPIIEVCRWRESLRSIPSVFDRDPGYEPTPDRPIVFHLHGFDAYPASLVLTEDDHLDFLANISQDVDAVPPRLRRALTECSLVLIGYRLQDWDFRVLFRGLIANRPPSMWMTSIAIQLEKDATLQDYLEKYLKQVRFSVAWQDPSEFVSDLYNGWQAG